MNAARLFVAVALAAFTLAGASVAMAQRVSRETPIEVEVETLFTAWNVGAIGSTNGGLPRTLWNQSDPDTLALLFDRVPGDFASPAARSLARRALASVGEAPSGDSLLASRRRFEALGRMGATQDLLIMARPSAVANDTVIAQYAAQAELAQGDLAGACGRAAAAGSGFLLRLRAFCAAIEGNVGAVDLALALSRESGEARDQWYEQALGMLGGVNPARAIPARYDTTLNTWASLATGIAPGRNPLTQSSTLALLTLAGEDRTEPRLRAEAALLALARSALEPSRARDLFRAALASGDGRNVPALSLAIAQSEALPGGIEAATAAHAALAGARTPAEFTAIARILREDLMQLREVPGPSEGLVLARGAIAAGDSGTGLRLIELAQMLGAEQSAYGSLRAAAWAASPRLTDESALRTVRQRIDDGAGDGRAMRDVMILQALGFPLDNAVRRAQLARAPEGGRPADGAVLAALLAASDAGSMGETALLAAIACAPGPGQLDAHSVWTILVSLRLVGLEDEAQAIAAEALLGP
jgi:hypothetical protein